MTSAEDDGPQVNGVPAWVWAEAFAAAAMDDADRMIALLMALTDEQVLRLGQAARLLHILVLLEMRERGVRPS